MVVGRLHTFRIFRVHISFPRSSVGTPFGRLQQPATLVQRPANGLDNLYQEWFADIRPAKRLGQGLVKEGDERQNPAFEFFG